jgi:Acetyl xylan esterase (AXE1)
MDLDVFAEYFTTHLPITALVYDNRCLGASEGLPRGEIIPYFQQSDLQDAITYAQSLAEVDAEKIAIWGTSYSGGHVLQVAAVDRRVKAVLAQGPLICGWETFRRMVRASEFLELEKLFVAGFTNQRNRSHQIEPQECREPKPQSFPWSQMTQPFRLPFLTRRRSNISLENRQRRLLGRTKLQSKGLAL